MVMKTAAASGISSWLDSSYFNRLIIHKKASLELVIKGGFGWIRLVLAASGARPFALFGSSLLVCHPAPHAITDVKRQSVFQAIYSHWAFTTD